MKAPGKADREGMTLIELMQQFPNEQAARKWFEAQIWPNGRHCPRCGSAATVECGGSPPMPYWCPDCRRHFSVRVGTLMECSKISLQNWAIAIYLHLTSLKGVSSMKLHRDLGITQKSAWFMLHRIRKAFDGDDDPPFSGPVEADETYVGGKEKNKHAHKKLRAGRGAVGKTAVAGVKDRASGKVSAAVVEKTDATTLQGFVRDRTQSGVQVFTDDASAYKGIDRPHEAVKHSVGEYVRDMAHTNGLESFWAGMKRGFQGVYHKMSPKHLNRYVTEFAGRHNIRRADTMTQMRRLAEGMVGKRLTYLDLIADNGLASGARAA